VNDHHIFGELFRQCEKTKDVDEKRKIMDVCIAEISMHASVEEQYVYPLFRKYLDNGDIIAERNITDDQLNKDIMDLLEKMDPMRDGELYIRTVRKLITIENEHLKQEEEWFDLLRPKLSKEELARLEDTLIKAKETAPTHPHPMSVNKPSTGATILHPIVGKIDRMVDSVTGRTTQK
jgi:DNA-directed RNA polymerase sigma subunit (sigma70/sigma32)